jgi:hypothetical protein
MKAPLGTLGRAQLITDIDYFWYVFLF